MSEPTPWLPPVTPMAWDILQHVAGIWAQRQAPVLQNARVQNTTSIEWRGRIDLDAQTCAFNWERDDRDEDPLLYAVVSGTGRLTLSPSTGRSAPTRHARSIGARMWLFPRYVRLSILPSKQRREGLQLYEGEFHDGQVDWKVHDKGTYDAFSLTPVVVPARFERLLRRHAYLALLVG